MNTRHAIRLFVLMVLIANARFAFADSVAARKLVAAQAAFDKQDWANAAALYRELAAENPNQGAFWYAIGGAEYSAKHFAEAADAYQRAVGVGYQVAVSHYNRACCLALMGEAKPACDALELAIRAGLRDRENMLRTDTDLDKIRDTQEFRSRILPAVMPETSRADAWKIDLDYLTKRVEETHYAPWRNISRDDWNAEMARIEAAAPTMKDHEIIVALMQLVVRLGDGHSATRVPHEGKLAFHTLPLRFYEFKDGVYVREAGPAYTKLLGRRVVRIGATPIDQALDKVATTAQRDNEQQVRWITAANLSCVEILNALGIAKSLDTVDVTTADAKGKETTVSVKAGPFPPMQHEYRVMPQGWVDLAPVTTASPLWRRNPTQLFTADYLEDSKLVYANFRGVADTHDETLAQFGDRVMELSKSKHARALVIDVRTNTGGNNFLGRAFFEDILKSDYNAADRLFVITGRETFSACQNFCNWLDRSTAAMFVGEPTGSRPNFVGEGNQVVLPYSGVIVNASSRLWQDSVSEDMRVWIAPELGAEMTSDDYRNNRDPAFDAIVEYLKTRDTVAAGP